MQESLPLPLSPEAVPALEPPGPFPRFWGAVGLILLYIVIQVAFTVPIAVTDFFRHTTWAAHPALSSITMLLASVGVVIFAASRTGRGFFTFLGPWNVPLRLLPGVALCVAGNLATAIGAAVIVQALLPAAGKLSTQLLSAFGVGSSPVAALILMVIAAPLAEETVMRGVILRGLLEAYSRPFALVIGATLFALAHINPVQFIGAFVIGSLLGWWFSELGSIWLGVLAHALNNLIPYLSLLAYSKANVAPKHFTWMYGIVFLLPGLFLLFAGIYLCRREFQARRTAPLEPSLPVTLDS